jgi:hypothetical protein
MPKAKTEYTPIQKPEVTPYLDQPPAGWFALDVLQHQSESDWVAVMISVHPNDIAGPVVPLPGEFLHGWLPIPGQHSTREAAWKALEDMTDDIGTAWWNGLRDDWRAFWMREAGDTGRAKDAWEEYKRQSASP